MIIPVSELSADVLRAVIEQYVLAEGTDYGDREFSLAQKVDHVRAQLERGEAVIVYSELHESVHIVLVSQVGQE